MWVLLPLTFGCTLTACDSKKTTLVRDLGTASAVIDKDASHPGQRPLATAGPHKIEVKEFIDAVAEARALRHWKAGKAAPIAALKNPRFRRKLLVRALETRIVRNEVERRNLQLDPLDIERLLQNAMLGLTPMSRATGGQIATLPKDPDDIDARLVARYGIPAVHVRRVAQDLSEHGALARELLAAVPERKIRTAWEDQETCYRVETFRIPRVPTSQEIEDAVAGRQPDIKAYFNENQRLFSRPARIFMRRFRALIPKNAPAAAVSEAHARVVAARARVVKGEDLESLVRKEGAEQDRRSGGRVTVKKVKKPELFEKPSGFLTEVERTPYGWAFYRIEGNAPEMKRLLSDTRVQREIGAALLRRDDTLPSAAHTADILVTKLTSKASTEVLKPWLKSKRIRLAQTKRFCRTSKDRVPTIGLAPEFARAVFALNAEAPVSQKVTVRQDYVIARLIERTDPTEAQWSVQKETLIEKWRASKGPMIVKEWLNAYLRTVTLGLAIERLNAMTIEELTTE